MPLSGRGAQKRRVALAALLAMAPSRTFTRDRLLAYLWPESDSQRGRHLLAVGVHELRKVLGEDVILTRGDDLELGGKVRCDVHDFEEACASGDAERAVALYRGPLLDGFHIGEAESFEEWLAAERQRLGSLHARMLERLARGQTESGDALAAVGSWRALAQLDPYNARVARELMLALDAAGDRAGALQHARIHALLLREEFEAEPDPEVEALAELLRSAPGTPSPGGRSEEAGPEGDGATGEPPEPEGEPEGRPSPTEMALPPPAASAPAPPTSIPEDEVARPVPARRWPRRVATAVLVVAPLAVVLSVAWALRPTATTEVPTVVVLPFQNLSPAPDNTLLGDGLSEEISTALGRLEGLNVVARTSAIALREGSHDVREIGRLLGSSHVIEGTVNAGLDRIKVSARLVNVISGHVVWSEEYDRPLNMADQLALQEGIARAVVGALRLRLGSSVANEPLVTPTTDNLAAYNLYLAGRQQFDRRSVPTLLEALRYFQEATELDPDYASALAAQAEVYTLLGAYEYSVFPPAQAFEAARRTANRALELDPGRAEAYAALGNVHFNYDRDHQAAEAAFRRAIDVNRGYAPAYHWYSLFLATRERWEESQAAILRAGELDPASRVTWAARARHKYFRRDFAGAIEDFTAAVERDSTFVTSRLGLALTLAVNGELDQAIAHLERAALLVGPDAPVIHALMGYAHGRAGHLDVAQGHLDRLTALAARAYVAPEFAAVVHLGMGDHEGAIEAFERALAERSGGIAYIAIEPILDPLRNEERFQDLVARAGS